MPLIVFDPPSEMGSVRSRKLNRVQRGGVLDGPQRAEYVELCKQMTSRKSDINYPYIRDAILAILEKDVRSYIETLPESDRAALVADIDRIFSSIDRSDNNYLGTINIVSLQICILFNQYILKNKRRNNFEAGDTDDVFEELTKSDEWKDYLNMKSYLENYPKNIIPQWNLLLTPNNADAIFMIYIGFLKLNELIESYLNNVFYFSLSYSPDWADGSYYLPLDFLSHDIFHYETHYYSSRDKSNIIEGFKQFRKYVLNTQDKSIQYSIDFALFIIIHEGTPYDSFKEDNLENELQNNATVDSIFNILNEYIDEFTDLDNLGRAIPREYREVVKKGESILLKKEKIQEYLRLVAERYVKCWETFKNSNKNNNKAYKGGRRRLGTRKRHTLRISRKKRKTHKMHK